MSIDKTKAPAAPDPAASNAPASERDDTRTPPGTPPPAGPRLGPRGVTALVALAAAAVIAAFVAVAWSSELARRGLARLSPYVPLLVYVAAVVALAASLWPRLRRRVPRSLPGSIVTAAAFVGASLCYLTVIFFTWERGRGLNTTLGGAVPWADANLYLGGAERLLFFGRIDGYNSHRPLQPMFLSLDLAITNLDVRFAIMAQALLVAGAAVLAARVVAKTLGLVAGVALFACLFSFSYFYATTTVTENLGLIFGALAFAAMWTAVSTRNRWLAISGVGLLSVGLGVRSGAMLLLVVLPFWFAWRWRGSKRLDVRVLACALAAATLGTVLNYGMVAGLGGDAANVNGNAGYLYYGMAQGRPGWDQRTNAAEPAWHEILRDYPHLFQESNSERSEFVNRKAREEVLAHPVRFTTTALRSGNNYLGMARDDVFAAVHASWIRWATAGLVALVGSVFVVSRWRTERRRVLLDLALFGGVVLAVPAVTDIWIPGDPGRAVVQGALGLLGFLAFVVVGTRRLRLPDQLSFTVTALAALAVSIPFLGIDTVRVLAATAPFFAVLIALGAAVLARLPASARPRPTDTAAVATPAAGSASSWVPVWLGGGLLVVILVGSPIAMVLVDRPGMPTERCPDGSAAEPLIGGIGIELVGDEPSAKRAVDQLHIGDFRKNTTFFAPFATGPLSDIHSGQTLMTGLARDGDDRIALVEGLARAPRSSTLQLCGATVHDPPADGLTSTYTAPIDFFYGRPLR